VFCHHKISFKTFNLRHQKFAIHEFLVFLFLIMEDKLHLYFKNAQEWREWLHENHQNSKGVYLIFIV